MKVGIVIGLVVVAIVAMVALIFGSMYLVGEHSAPPTEMDHRIAELEEEKARLESEVELLEEAVKKLPAEGTADEPAPPDPLPSERLSDAPFEGLGGTPEPEESESGPSVRFFADAYGGALREVDWELVGNNLSEMNPLIVSVVHSIRAQERPEAATIGRIQQLNGPLLAAALTLPDEVPGTGVNGKFSDPGFMVNAMSSCLAAAGLPLSAAQERDLEAVAAKWMDLDERRRAGYDETTWTLRQLYEEAELKDGYFAEALGTLTAEQRAILDPEETHDRVRLALFSSSLLYVGRVDFCFFTSTEDLKEKYLRRTTQIFDFSDADRDLARPIVQAWVDSIPVEERDAEVTTLDRNGLVESSRITVWARHIVDLVEQIVARLPLSEEQRETARSIGGVYLPLRVDPE